MYAHLKFWQETLRSLQTSNTLGNLIGKELSYVSQRASQWCVHSSVGRMTFAKKTHPVISLPPSPSHQLSYYTVYTSRELPNHMRTWYTTSSSPVKLSDYQLYMHNTCTYLCTEHNNNITHNTHYTCTAITISSCTCCISLYKVTHNVMNL